MADRIGTRDVRELTQDHQGPCVSIYQVCEPAAPESHQNPIRFKKLLHEASLKLKDTRLSAANRQRLLAPADELLDDDWFWTHQSNGLAVFLAEGYSRHFRLPQQFDDNAFVGDHFRVRPLLSFMQSLSEYYVLTASENACQLWRGDRFGVQNLDVASLPGDLASALRLDDQGAPELNLHSIKQTAQPGSGMNAMFHGHAQERKESEMEEYFRQIDAALWEFLRDQKTPLLFAGVADLFPIYKRVNSYPYLVDRPLSGSSDRLTAAEIHKAAWPIVEAATRNELNGVHDELSGRLSQHIATDRVPLMVQAASSGLVDTLVIANGAQAWGAFDAALGQTTLLDPHDPGSVDLLEFAAQATLHSGGRVLISDRLEQNKVAFALLRAPVETLAAH